MTYSALPSGHVAIAHLEGPIDVDTATIYAGWLKDAARNATCPRLRASLTQSASELRAVIREATNFRHMRAQ